MNPLLDTIPFAGLATPPGYEPTAFRIQWARLPWMQREAMALRRLVFCDEQRLFDRDDRDTIDEDPDTRLLAACSTVAGIPDEVVGTVRIHPAYPAHAAGGGTWWGSRLAVAPHWRRHAQLGTSLIRLAVCSAHAEGCTEFRAHVQLQNVPLFRRLHWTSIGEVQVAGMPHALMVADLAHYPPCTRPEEGFVLARAAA